VQSLDDDLVIIEGIGVFDERFDFLNLFRVYVDTPDALRSERANSRDIPTADRSAEEWAKIYKIWESEASLYIEQSRNRADIIVRDSGPDVANFIIEQTKKF
jgi:uridine kinase